MAAAGRTVLYQGVGDRLTQWDVDVDAATLTPRASITLPSNIQYVRGLIHSRKYLYVSTAMLHGEPAALPQRPIHNSVDTRGNFALTCYNNPSNLTVHHINDDGTVGAQIYKQPRWISASFAHQILPMPGNRSVIMVTRGNRPETNKAEDPGALKIFHFKEGQLSPLANLAVGGKGGLGYGPRHLDFHPAQPWTYVSVKSQNELHMHRLEADSLSQEPLYKKRSTIGSYDIYFPQAAGGIHVHPNGRMVYLSNRTNATMDFDGKKVFRGGENNIAVFSIDPAPANRRSSRTKTRKASISAPSVSTRAGRS